MKTIGLIIAVALIVGACATPKPGALDPLPELPVTALEVIYVGGCNMLPPGCVSYTVQSDGSWSSVHARDESATDHGSIDATLVEQLMTAAQETNFAELRATLPPGRCTAPADGVDVMLGIWTPDGTEDLDSCVNDLSGSDELLEAIRRVVSALP